MCSMISSFLIRSLRVLGLEFLFFFGTGLYRAGKVAFAMQFPTHEPKPNVCTHAALSNAPPCDNNSVPLAVQVYRLRLAADDFGQARERRICKSNLRLRSTRE